MPFNPIIFGTAGHIDHGKTTLTRALTGQDTDRLPEEKTRGISIDLGFAHFKLKSGQPAALIDVPGHERFIRNMVAGVHGMDAVLLVVAADEGVMPQTREHLDILSLLGVETGLTVITKADLVDADWLELVRETTREALAGTFLAESPMLSVDAVSGHGMEALQEALESVARKVEPRSVQGHPRMPIDRVFSIKGFGTVATGTLINGQLTVEQAVELAPEGTLARIRSLEVHKQKVGNANAGQRVAVNLAGVERADVHRGQVISPPGVVHGVNSMVVQLTILTHAPAIERQARVHCHIGTGEAIGRVYFYDRDQAEPGTTGFAEIRLESPLAVVRGDRFLLRSYSPVSTIAGGSVLEIDSRHRRRELGLIERLEQLAQGSDTDLVRNLVRQASVPLSPQELAQQCGVPQSVVQQALTDSDEFVQDADRWWWGLSNWENWSARVRERVDAYHQEHPLRVGIGREQLRAEVAGAWPVRAFIWALSMVSDVVSDREWVRMATFSPQPPVEMLPEMSRVEEAFGRAELHPKTLETMAQELSLDIDRLYELVQYEVNRGTLIRLEDGIYIAESAYRHGVDAVRAAMADGTSLGVAELKETLGTNRRFAVSFLELLDKERITRRLGDKRTLAG